jgi:branched-chain amino acid transport system ATP-binding protein
MNPMLDAPQTTDTLLEVNNIEVIYNHVILVLKGVSLAVPKGRITALLGGNGAGKTTTLKAVSNLLRSERGEVTKGSISFLSSLWLPLLITKLLQTSCY